MAHVVQKPITAFVTTVVDALVFPAVQPIKQCVFNFV
jgi:hypothetical protein